MNYKTLSLIRITSMIFIILSHITQYYENVLFLLFNVGVQIFLIISGMLYGSKHIEDFKKWYLQRFKRILVPYYLFLFIAYILLFIVEKDIVIFESIIPHLFLIQGFLSKQFPLGNLWFISYLILCYFLLPFLQKFDISKDPFKKNFIRICLIILFLLVLEYYLGFYKLTSNILAFVLGYYFSKRYNYHQLGITTFSLKVRKYFVYLLPLTIVIYLSFVNFRPSQFNVLAIIKYLLPLVFGGSMFFSLYLFFSRFTHRLSENKYIKKLDRYSYYIYLTHYLFIIGELSLMSTSQIIYLNIFLVLIVTLIFSILLELISSKITRLIFKEKTS